MFDNKNTDSVLKNGHADKSDFSEKKKSENGNGLHESDENVLPGIRPDNLWLQYKSQMTDEELSSYWDKPFSVKTGSGFYAWSKPTIKLHVTGMLHYQSLYIVGCRGASQLGGPWKGGPPRV